jgi:hypothetical protein
MELVLAILVAGPLGYFMRDGRRALATYLVAWAVLFPVQTVVVHNTGGLDPLYFTFNVPILVLGLGLNHVGRTLAERRAAGAHVG